MTEPIEMKNANKPDKVKDYAHYSLEVGMTYAYFLKQVKSPDRQKKFALLKMMMLQL